MQRKLRDEKLKLVQPHEKIMTRWKKNEQILESTEKHLKKKNSNKKKSKKSQRQNVKDNEQQPHQEAQSDPGDECTQALSLPSVWRS